MKEDALVVRMRVAVWVSPSVRASSSGIRTACVVDCVDDPASCARAGQCECRVVYGLINERIVDVLQRYTLADLLDPEWVRAHGVGLITGAEDAPEGFGCNPTRAVDNPQD